MDVLHSLSDFDNDVPDLRLSGHVSFATTSSLEVFVRLSTVPTAPDLPSTTILLGRFAMACRKYSGGKQEIPRLIVEGEAEQELFEMGKQMKEAKTMRAATSLERTAPTAAEAKMMHDLFVGKASLFGQCILLTLSLHVLSSADFLALQSATPQCQRTSCS